MWRGHMSDEVEPQRRHWRFTERIAEIDDM
jgi:hypothetical protein